MISVYAVKFAQQLGYINFSKLGFPKFEKPSVLALTTYLREKSKHIYK